MVNSRRGRPAGGSDARERLLHAAQHSFFATGYVGTTVRAVAQQAGVSHTLVNYHFGGKEGLFTEVMAISLRPTRVLADALASPRGTSPLQQATQLVRMMLSIWSDAATSPQLVELLRNAVASDELRGTVTGFLSVEMAEQVINHIGGRDARARASAVASVMAGAIFTRYVLEVEPVTSLPQEDLVRVLAPMVALNLR